MNETEYLKGRLDALSLNVGSIFAATPDKNVRFRPALVDLARQYFTDTPLDAQSADFRNGLTTSTEKREHAASTRGRRTNTKAILSFALKLSKRTRPPQEICKLLAEHGYVEVRRLGGHMVMQKSGAGTTPRTKTIRGQKDPQIPVDLGVTEH